MPYIEGAVREALTKRDIIRNPELSAGNAFQAHMEATEVPSLKADQKPLRTSLTPLKYSVPSEERTKRHKIADTLLPWIGGTALVGGTAVIFAMILKAAGGMYAGSVITAIAAMLPVVAVLALAAAAILIGHRHNRPTKK